MIKANQLYIKEILRKSPPEFHFWDGEWQNGGFSDSHLSFLEKTITDNIAANKLENPKIVETGAGLSTLLFFSLGLNVTSFSLPDVLERISKFLAEQKIEVHWSGIPGFGEYTIPVHFHNRVMTHDFALIDGNHAIPSVFSDFIHLAGSLNNSGLIFIDDTQLPGPRGLCRFIEKFPDRWRFIGNENKLSCYEKISDFSIDCSNHVDVDIFK